MTPDDIDELEHPTLGGWSPRERIGKITLMGTPIEIPSSCGMCGAPATWVHLAGALFEPRSVILEDGAELCTITPRCDGCFSVEEQP